MGNILPVSKLDQRLVRGRAQGMTPDELSQYVNGQLTPAQCVVRLKDYLASMDFLTEIEQTKFYLVQAAEFLESMRGDALEIGNNATRATYLATLKTLIESSAKTTANLDNALGRVRESQARLMVRAVELALLKALATLRVAHPGITEAEARGALLEALPAAIAEVESATLVDEDDALY